MRHISWTARFLVGSIGGAVALIVLFFAVSGSRWLGLDVPATIALILGIVATIGLAVGLMALMFYSSRSGRDEMAGGEHFDRRPETAPGPRR